jgi:hypothetical protein
MLMQAGNFFGSGCVSPMGWMIGMNDRLWSGFLINLKSWKVSANGDGVSACLWVFIMFIDRCFAACG